MANRTSPGRVDEGLHDHNLSSNSAASREDIYRRLEDLSTCLSTTWPSDEIINNLDSILRGAEDLVRQEHGSFQTGQVYSSIHQAHYLRADGQTQEAATQPLHDNLLIGNGISLGCGDSAAGHRHRNGETDICEIAEDTCAKFEWLASEMGKRAAESRQICKNVSAWRESVAHGVHDFKEMATSYQEKSLAELRYLRHKIERLEIRIYSVTASIQDERTGLIYLEGNSRYQSHKPADVDMPAIPGVLKHSLPTSRATEPRQRESLTEAPAMASAEQVLTVEPGNIPAAIHRQIDRVQHEADEIEASMRSRCEDIAERASLMMLMDRER